MSIPRWLVIAEISTYKCGCVQSVTVILLHVSVATVFFPFSTGKVTPKEEEIDFEEGMTILYSEQFR